MIGADGVHSLIRDHVAGPEQPRFIGRLAYRTTFPAALLRGVEIGSSRTKWWGADRHIVIYFVTAARDEVYFTTSQPEQGRLDHAGILVRPKATSSELRAAFADFHPDVRAVLSAAPEVHKVGHLRARSACDLAQGPRRPARRCLPSDDALHGVRRRDGARRRRRARRAASPELDDVADAFRLYEATRKPRASRGADRLQRQHLDAQRNQPGLALRLRRLTAPLDGAALQLEIG